MACTDQERRAAWCVSVGFAAAGCSPQDDLRLYELGRLAAVAAELAPSDLAMVFQMIARLSDRPPDMLAELEGHFDSGALRILADARVALNAARSGVPHG